jgi:hypothetical protein
VILAPRTSAASNAARKYRNVSLATICRSSAPTKHGFCEGGRVTIGGKKFVYAMFDPEPVPTAVGVGTILSFAHSSCRSASLKVGVSGPHSDMGGVETNQNYYSTWVSGGTIQKFKFPIIKRKLTVGDTDSYVEIFYSGSFSCYTSNGKT